MNKQVLLAAAVTGLVLAGCASTSSKNSTNASVAQGECHGVNACKGQGECGGPGHECAGKNSCKGQGYLKLTKAQCDEKNGTFKASM